MYPACFRVQAHVRMSTSGAEVYKLLQHSRSAVGLGLGCAFQPRCLDPQGNGRLDREHKRLKTSVPLSRCLDILRSWTLGLVKGCCMA